LRYERNETVRQELARELEGGAVSAREISARLHISEREVMSHLPHLARSLSRVGRRLKVEPACCLACGFVFENRGRYTAPSRCPSCRSERIASPLFASEPV
jgi:transcriptional regulator